MIFRVSQRKLMRHGKLDLWISARESQRYTTFAAV